jgi:hypothetical protein
MTSSLGPRRQNHAGTGHRRGTEMLTGTGAIIACAATATAVG